MQLTGKSLIGFGSGGGGAGSFRAFNPATGLDLDPPFMSAWAAEVDRAVSLAQEAFGTLRRLSGHRRARLCRRIADALEANAREIVARAAAETALTAPRLEGELARTCYQLRLYGEAAETGLWLEVRIDHGDPQRKPQPRPDLRSFHQPVGPVVVFGASNFPLAYSVAGGDTASALATGCPVIVKAHQAHPGTSELVGRCVQEAVRAEQLPEGTFSLIFGPGNEVGTQLVRHPLIKGVGFTGSRAGGRALMDAAAARPEPIPVYAEMGSINPVVILPGALAERGPEIATGLHASFTLGVGQFCTNPGLVLTVTGAATEPFLARLAELTAGTPVGTMLTRGICKAYRAGVSRFAKVAGVTQLAAAAAPAGQTQVGATLLTCTGGTFLGRRELMDEIFGPATLVVQCVDVAQLRSIVAQLEAQLTATLHADDAELASAADLIATLATKAGRLVCNGFPTGVEVAHAMVHGGPYPAASSGAYTSVGTRALLRWAKLTCFQNFPEDALPEELQEANPLGLCRLVDGRFEPGAGLPPGSRATSK
jgi:alpha-ketoglutaric semialdehyde dehydrogenase